MLRRLLAGWVPASLRRRSLPRNVIMNWTAALLGAATSLGLTPVVVRSLDREAYGVWTFLNGLTLYSNLLYVGLGSAFMKRLSEAVGREDTPAQTRLLGIAWTIYTGLGLTCLAIALSLEPVIPSMFATPLPPEMGRAASATVGLLGVRLALMFVNSAFTALLTSHGRLDLVGGVYVVATVVRTVGLLWATSQPAPLMPLAAMLVLDAALQLPAFMILCRLVAPGVRLRPTMPTRIELRSLYGFGVQAFIVQIALLVISYTDTALIGVLLGAGAVGVYALPLQLVEQSRMLVNGVTQNLLPELSAFKARGEMDRLGGLFLLASRSCAALSAFINVHLVLLGPAFLTLWVGPAMAGESPRILLFLAMAATAGALSTQVMTPFYMALDLVRVLVVIVIAEAAINFALSIWLARTVGVWGVALATAIPAIGVTLLLAPRPLLARLDMSAARFARHAFGPALALALASTATQALLSRWLPIASYLDLVLRVAASVAVCLPVVALTFDRDELPGPLRRLLGR